MNAGLSDKSIYLYVPNIIGYVRLLLLAIGWLYIDQPAIFVVLYSTSASLDFFDGYFARKLNQASSFGAWLDVVTDNIGRTLIWSQVAKWSWVIISLEWSSFVCTHCRGSNWKSSFEKAPWLVTKVMDNGFYTPLGVLVVLGLHVLPLALYIEQNPPYGLQLEDYHAPVYCIIALLTIGRIVCGLVEGINIVFGYPVVVAFEVTTSILQLWTVYEHAQHLVSDDMNQQLSSLTDDLQKSRHNSTN